jgi:hypothetical protein
VNSVSCENEEEESFHNEEDVEDDTPQTKKLEINSIFGKK